MKAIKYITPSLYIKISGARAFTRLTLTLEKEAIDQAKKYASQKGRSLSEMVENYFRYITGFKSDEEESFRQGSENSEVL